MRGRCFKIKIKAIVIIYRLEERRKDCRVKERSKRIMRKDAYRNCWKKIMKEKRKEKKRKEKRR